MSSPRPDLITLGEPLGVMLAESAVPLPEATRFDLQVTGAETNVVVGLSRLGHATALISAVGTDPLGDRVLKVLRAEGVQTGWIRRDDSRPTGLLVRDVITARPTTVSYFRTATAATALTADDVDAELVASARVLHLTGLTAALSASAFEATLRAADLAREAGVPVSFDPNVRRRLASPERWAEIVTALASRCDIAFPGDADLAASIGPVDPIAWFHDQGAGTVVLKEGANGSCESSGGAVVRAPAHPVAEVDSIGAGDAFAAGWISAWLRDLPAAERLREAAVVAACVVAARGDLTGLPTAAVRDQILSSSTEADR